MAILTLTSADAGKTIPVSGSADWVVYGTDAADTIEVAAGSSATVNGGAGTDVVKLLGGSADYTVKLSGSNVVFTHTSTGKTVTVPVTSAGDSVSFGNGTAVTLKSTGSVVTLGAQTISATDAAVTGATGTATGSTPTTAGQAFSLTTTAESKTLTAGNDTVDGSTVLDSISSDTIIDASTTDNDTLNILVTGSINPSTVANVENVNVTAKYGSATVTGANYSGVKQLVADSAIASGSAIVTGASATSIAAVKASTNVSSLEVRSGTEGTGTSVAVNAGSATSLTLQGTTAKADTFNLTLNGGNTGLTLTTLTEANDKINLTGATAANTVTIAGTTGVKTLVVDGAQDLTLKGAAASFGGNTVTNNLSGKSLTVQVTGGTTAAAFDLSKVAATTIQLDAGTSTSTGFTLANNANVKLNNTDNTVFTTTGSTDTLNIDLAKATTGTLTNTTFTKANFAANTVAVTSLDAQMGTSADVVITGSKDVTLAAGSTSKSVDASALTGKLTATLDTGFLKLTGSNQADTVTLANTASRAYNVNAGQGDDTVTINLATANANTAITIDGGQGTDTLKVGAGLDISGATVVNSVISGIEVIDLNGSALTVSQKQGFMLGNTFTVASSSATPAFTVKATDAGGSGVIDLSGVTLQGTATLTANASAYTLGGTSLTGSAHGDSILGSDGADTIVAGGGADTVLGGKGADKITLTESVNLADKVVTSVATTTTNAHTGILGTGGSVTIGSSSATATTVTGADVVTNAKAGDALVFLGGYTAGVAATATTTALLNTVATAATVSATNSLSLIKGVYNSTSNNFYADAAGTDSLVVFDADTATASQEWQAIVLVGFAGTGTVATDGTDYAGVTNDGFTLTLA